MKSTAAVKNTGQDKRVIKPRNSVACSPLMKKGGVHDRGKGGKRQQGKQQARKLVNEALGGTQKGILDRVFLCAAWASLVGAIKNWKKKDE